jgi:hypothetical protein
MNIPLDYVYIRVIRLSCGEWQCDVARANIHSNNVALSISLKFYAGPIFLFPNSPVRYACNGHIYLILLCSYTNVAYSSQLRDYVSMVSHVILIETFFGPLSHLEIFAFLLACSSSLC